MTWNTRESLRRIATHLLTAGVPPMTIERAFKRSTDPMFHGVDDRFHAWADDVAGQAMGAAGEQPGEEDG